MSFLFFELLQVSLGTRETLSRVPTSDEWQQLYDMAERQAILGICFVGVSRLHELSEINANDNANQQSITDNCEPITKNLPRKLFIRWAGRAAIIQERNEKLDRYCDTLTTQFREAGFDTCILKGQGVARLYDSCENEDESTLHLSQYRQPGDIDIWIWPKGQWELNHDERMRKVVGYLKTIGECSQPTYHNTAVSLDSDIPVEVHYTPSWLYSPIHNRRLQRWFDSMAPTEMQNQFSTLEFNRLMILLHIYRHLFGEGIGLRQVIDYYFVLRSCQQSAVSNQQSVISGQQDLEPGTLHSPLYTLHFIKELGLEKFAGALLWVINEVCIGNNPNNNNPASCIDSVELKFLYPALNKNREPLVVNQKEGRFLLDEIMMAGNFGKFDTRYNYKSGDKMLSRYVKHVSRNLHFLTHYPSEVLWCPLWKIWHQLWRLLNF